MKAGCNVHSVAQHVDYPHIRPDRCPKRQCWAVPWVLPPPRAVEVEEAVAEGFAGEFSARSRVLRYCSTFSLAGSKSTSSETAPGRAQSAPAFSKIHLFSPMKNLDSWSDWRSCPIRIPDWSSRRETRLVPLRCIPTTTIGFVTGSRGGRYVKS